MVHEQREAAQQEESPSPEVAAFCSLIAGIVLRCLRQHDTHLERFLFLPAQSVEQQKGGAGRPLPALSPVGCVRRSSHMQGDNYSIDAQRRANLEECTRRCLLPAVFYGDDDCSTRRAGRLAPPVKRLLEDVEARQRRVVFVRTLDR